MMSAPYSEKKDFLSTLKSISITKNSSEHPIRKYWFIIVFLACFACFFHMYTVLGEYRKYTVNTLVKNYEFGFKFPDVTICTTVPFSRRKVGTFQRTGLWRARDFWKTIRSSVNETSDNNFQRAMLSFHKIAYERDIYTDLFKNIHHCYYNKQVCNSSSFKKYTNVERLNCITFLPSKRDIIQANKQRGLHIILSLNDGFAQLNPEAELYHTRGFEVILHEQGTLPKIGKDALIVEPGKQVTIKLTMKNYTRLNTPNSSCNDEFKVENFEDHAYVNSMESSYVNFQQTYRYTEEDCLAIKTTFDVLSRCKCKLESHSIPWTWNVSVPFCHEIPRSLFFSNKIDSPFDETSKYEMNKLRNRALIQRLRKRSQCVDGVVNGIRLEKHLHDECPQRCKKSMYKTDPIFTNWPTSSSNLTKSKINQTLNAQVNSAFALNMGLMQVNYSAEFNNMVSILVYPSDLSIDVIRESLAYPMSQLFADFGGNIGLWMGVSLLTLAELIEFFLQMLVSKFQKRNFTKEENNMEERNIQDEQNSISNM